MTGIQTAASKRAWRGASFQVPGFDAPFGAGGFAVTPSGGLATVTGRAAVRQAVIMLLLTRPGERVMRPHYGCELYRLMFWPNDDTTAGLAIHYVRQAIARFEPRVDRVRVDARARPDDPSVLEVTLEFRVRSTGEEDRVAVQLDLGSGSS